MNLEHAEELCLNYLAQASNPLVPIQTLLEYCRRDEQCAAITEQELLSFLRPHSEVLVVDGPEPGEVLDTSAYEAAGLNMGARVILRLRVPAPQEMLKMIEEQLGQMVEAIGKAMTVAENEKGAEGAGPLREALTRAETLRERMHKLF